ncbi:glutaredoxin family protein (plasmid) [Haladaptatus sp. SPP-AMP-3]|uniref:glutaredoxin family protein n=1 Tax=Haladaptatus sp. SPP-AMP-3 TaxID=3121295 RepID=UPI003C2FC61B
MDRKRTVTVYTRDDCHLCEDAIETVRRVADAVSSDVTLDLRDVDSDPQRRTEYGDRVPYVLVDGRPRFKYRVDEEELRALLVRKSN